VHDYIHVADVARANVMAMESDVARESFNVATVTATTLNRLVEIVQKHALESHNMKATREQVLSRARPET